MNRTQLVLTLLSGLASLVRATEELETSDLDDRQVLTGNGVSITIGYTAFLFGITALIALGVLLALSYFYATGDSGFSGYSGTGSGSSYSSYGRKT